jgi:hypothetical protein
LGFDKQAAESRPWPLTGSAASWIPERWTFLERFLLHSGAVFAAFSAQVKVLLLSGTYFEGVGGQFFAAIRVQFCFISTAIFATPRYSFCGCSGSVFSCNFGAVFRAFLV